MGLRYFLATYSTTPIVLLAGVMGLRKLHLFGMSTLRPWLVLLVTMPRSCRQRQFTPKAGYAGRLCSSRLSQAKIIGILVDMDQQDSYAHGVLLATQKGTHSANCAAALTVEMAQVQFLDNLLARCVQ